MLALGPWYTSGTFWGAAGVLAALIGAAAVLVTWRLGAPRRLLTYSVPVLTSLLTPDLRGFESPDVEVTYHGHKLGNPYVATLRVESRSRRDIRSVDFDQGRPLVFDFKAPIIAVLGGAARTGMESLSKVLSIDGTRVLLAPLLVHKGIVLSLTLLTDGRPRLMCQSPLIDVNVREQAPDERRPLAAVLSAAAAAVSSLVGAIGAAILISWTATGTGKSSHTHTEPGAVIGLAAALFLGSVAVFMFSLWLRRGHRRG